MQAVIELNARGPVLPRFPAYGIGILESRHSKEFKMPVSCYDFSEIMLVLEGQGSVCLSGRREPVKTGDIVIVPEGTSYCFEDDPAMPLAMLALCIRPAPGLRSVFKPVLPERFVIRRRLPIIGEVRRALRVILFEQSRPRGDSGAIVVAHTLLLLSLLARRKGSGRMNRAEAGKTELLARVRAYVESLETDFHVSESLKTVADRLGMSSRTLTGLFRSITGLSRQSYIQDLRLLHACRLLVDTNQSVTSIAFACGFEDVSNFFRAFRKSKKMSPSQWRDRFAQSSTS